MITLISAILALAILAIFFIIGSKITNEKAYYLVWILIGFSFYGMATIIREAINIILR